MPMMTNPVIPASAAIPGRADAGLPPRLRELWRASLRYRLLADDLAARAPGPR